MTDQEAEISFAELIRILREYNLVWLATQIEQEAAEGSAVPKILAVSGRYAGDEIERDRGGSRRRIEFTHVRPFSPQEKLRLAIDAINTVVVASAQMFEEIQSASRAENITIRFMSETEQPGNLVTREETEALAAAARHLSERLAALRAELDHGA